MANSKSTSSKPRKRSAGNSSPNGSSAKSKGGGASRSRQSTSRAKQSQSRAKQSQSRSRQSAASRSRPRAAGAAVDERAGRAADAAKKAKGPVKEVAAKAKGPALALGAAAAGVAGGMLLKGRRRKRVLGVPLPRSTNGSHLPDLDVKSIAKGVSHASQAFARTSRTISRDLERASDQAERIGTILGGDQPKSEDARRSPVEVVLDGLTHRRG